MSRIFSQYDISNRRGVFFCALLALAQAAFAQDNPTRITMSDSNEIMPAWEPGSSRIAFLSDEPPAIVGGQFYNIALMDLNSAPATQLIATGPNTGIGLARSISWIGASGHLAVLEGLITEEILAFDVAQGLSTPFDRVVGDGPDTAFTPLLMYSASMQGRMVRCSYDGTTLLWPSAFLVTPPFPVDVRIGALVSLAGQTADGVGSVEYVFPDGNFGFVLQADISPDGTQFVTGEPTTSGFDLHYHHVGNNPLPINLTQNGAQGYQNLNPAFSPDGTKVAFVQIAPGQEFGDVFIVGVDGSGLTQVTDTPDLEERDPTWSPDGQFLVYSRFDTTASGALAAGEAESYNLYIHDLNPPAPPSDDDDDDDDGNDQSSNDILEPGDEILDPPTVIVDDESGNVTVIMKDFADFSLNEPSAAQRLAFPTMYATKSKRRKRRITWKAELTIEASGERRRKRSKTNVLTFSNVSGSGSVRYKASVTAKRNRKRLKKKSRFHQNNRTFFSTSYSPPQSYVRQGIK